MDLVRRPGSGGGRHSGAVTALALGESLIVGADAVYAYDRQGRQVGRLPIPGSRWMALDHFGETAVALQPQTVSAWSIRTGQRLAAVDVRTRYGRVAAVAADAGFALVTGLPGEAVPVGVVELAGGRWRQRALDTVDDPDEEPEDADLGDTNAAFTGDDGFVAVGEAGALRRLDRLGHIRRVLDPMSRTRAVCDAGDGTLWCAGVQYRADLRDAASGAVVRTLHASETVREYSDGFHAVAAAAGWLAAGGTGGRVSVWHTAADRPAVRLEAAADVVCLAFNADGTELAAGCADGSVHVWHPRTELTRNGS